MEIPSDRVLSVARDPVNRRGVQKGRSSRNLGYRTRENGLNKVRGPRGRDPRRVLCASHCSSKAAPRF